MLGDMLGDRREETRREQDRAGEMCAWVWPSTATTLSKSSSSKDHTDKSNLLQELDKVPYRGGGTETGKALDFIRTEYFTSDAGSRRDQRVPQIAVVITDGDSTDEVLDASQRLKQLGVLVFTIGVGQANAGQLQEIASRPFERFMLTIDSYQALTRLTEGLLQTVCVSMEDIRVERGDRKRQGDEREERQERDQEREQEKEQERGDTEGLLQTVCVSMEDIRVGKDIPVGKDTRGQGDRRGDRKRQGEEVRREERDQERGETEDRRRQGEEVREERRRVEREEERWRAERRNRGTSADGVRVHGGHTSG
ncbi:hypothetical protein WMY93_033069 [Mugilogobius chulae]|uniref:VWFA domain-containing protein n=1 Tax=Mugilogobius chulae TaxID=88201 RepID=A0AAW0MI04_9GOBI